MHFQTCFVGPSYGVLGNRQLALSSLFFKKKQTKQNKPLMHSPFLFLAVVYATVSTLREGEVFMISTYTKTKKFIPWAWRNFLKKENCRKLRMIFQKYNLGTWVYEFVWESSCRFSKLQLSKRYGRVPKTSSKTRKISLSENILLGGRDCTGGELVEMSFGKRNG